MLNINFNSLNETNSYFRQKTGTFSGSVFWVSTLTTSPKSLVINEKRNPHQHSPVFVSQLVHGLGALGGPGDGFVPLRNAFFTRFDGRPLSERSEAFQNSVAEEFVRFGLLGDVEESEELNEQDPRLAYARAILEDEEALQSFLDAPENFLDLVFQNMGIPLDEEVKEQFNILADDAAFVKSQFDFAELGEAPGDGDTYILIGTDSGEGIPSPETFEWLREALDECSNSFGFLPGYGNYASEAVLRGRVILGPGVSEREKRFVKDNGSIVIDRRDGEPLGDLGS